MRVWLFPFKELSDQHILGQHRELHMLDSMLKNARFQMHPLVRFYSDKKRWLAQYHDAIVKEMDFRFDHTVNNGGHQTPLPYMDGLADWKIPQEWIEFDRLDLFSRYANAPVGKYRWTRRPKLIVDESFKNIKLNAIPLYVFVRKDD